ncbi:MAG: RHS repeat-associated core domain-containing protein [Sumerlaeia bacterium]
MTVRSAHRSHLHEYAYDGFGRRAEKTVDSGGANEEHTLFLYDGHHVIEERDGATGSLLASYVHGLGIDNVLTMQRDVDGNGTAEDYFYVQDDMGSPVLLVDAAGAIVERYDYVDYGRAIVMNPGGVETGTESQFGNPYLFVGRRWDGELGMYWNRTRHLHPLLGRFTTRDPLGIWGDASAWGNGYTYAGNNPWTYFDPFGLEKEEVDKSRGLHWDEPFNDAMERLREHSTYYGSIIEHLENSENKHSIHSRGRRRGLFNKPNDDIGIHVHGEGGGDGSGTSSQIFIPKKYLEGLSEDELALVLGNELYHAFEADLGVLTESTLSNRVDIIDKGRSKYGGATGTRGGHKNETGNVYHWGEFRSDIAEQVVRRDLKIDKELLQKPFIFPTYPHYTREQRALTNVWDDDRSQLATVTNDPAPNIDSLASVDPNIKED